MKISNILATLLLSTTLLLSCAKEQTTTLDIVTEDASLLRPNPGYVQYVRNRSLLAESATLLSTVSSSLYAFSTERPSAQTLRSMASVWLSINPALYVTDVGSSFLKSLAYANLLEILSKTGIQGLYISPLFGTSYLWTNNNKMLAYNEDAVQLEIASDIGSSQEFLLLRDSIGTLNMFFGTSLLPIATGKGADFWLATRGVEDYEGLYGLIPLPKEVWSSIHPVEQTQTLALSDKEISILRENNILPDAFLQDSFSYFPKIGWAVTAEIVDIHGEPQRYAYRYYRMPELPLLNMYNPTLQATRVLNASVVQSVGVYGSALVGFSIMPYYGLVDRRQATYSDSFYLPIAQHIERMVQQYGAFAFLQDSLPLSLVATILKDNDAVFIADSITYPYAEYALLSHTTSLLKEMLRSALEFNIPIERLVHTTTNEKGLPLYPLSLFTTNQKLYISATVGEKHREILTSIKKLDTSYPFMTEEYLPYTSPLLATIALGYPLSEQLQFQEKEYRSIINAHKALLFFKAMLPGLLMINIQDITAPLPMKQAEYERTGNTWNTTLAGYSGYTLQVLPYSTAINRFSIPIAKTIYPEFQTQDLTQYSIKKELETILTLRSQYDIMNTSMIEVLPTNDSVIALVLKNEKGELYIAITNFTNTKQTFSIHSSLPDVEKKLQNAKIRSYPSGKTVQKNIQLQEFGCMLLHIQ